MKNDRYPKSYGSWAGNPAGRLPDFSKCCEEVADTSLNWTHFHQCSRKRGFGPDEAYCRQHDPAAVEERRRASDERFTKEMNQRRVQLHGRTFYEALKQIAEGHNDARGLAQEVLGKFHEGDRR